ncbi:MAG: transposase family protein [Cyanobacteriota bacterium]|nr:transposase family protein [Cyanobacteriota bacterium]
MVFACLQNQYENIRIPHKKPKGKQLSEQQKSENKKLSQSRVICQNANQGCQTLWSCQSNLP